MAHDRIALAKAFHDGPLGADDFGFIAESEQGKWCLTVVDFFIAALAAEPAKEPCGECHLKPGETCDICNATQGQASKAGHFHGYRGQGHIVAPGAHEMED